MSDDNLSHDNDRANRQQRARRSRMVRIDYMPGDHARVVIEAKRATCRPGSIEATNSAVIDAIVTEWAELTGIEYTQIDVSMTTGQQPELSHHFARAYDFDSCSGERSAPLGEATRRFCGARTRKGHPCRAKAEPGKRRCKWHGGRSTGPRTPEGKAKALKNLSKRK
ncbi:HGGxSTG domain-containing protein [Marilutibacter spongiae]|uniref:Uncharacterized protein n=1 Tax=Marilutibacter spongiae TaxID=2025720 RepID=A0A7W3Y767_9GAMM|nr:HGGxSTG domain-containing protein [Lysobacter spongiae]MBB1061859.1 hypothetical protein [Lysobacter spongiae]